MHINIDIDIDLVNSDDFLSMPKDAQLLFYNMLIHQNEIGNVYNAKTLQRTLQLGFDSLLTLIGAGYVLDAGDGGYTVVTELCARTCDK